MNQDSWLQYKKYLQVLSFAGLKTLRDRVANEIKNEERRLIKQQIFDQRKKELDCIDEVILGKDEAHEN